MIIESNQFDQIKITITSNIDDFGLQRLLEYIKYIEATSKSKAKQKEIDKLADDVNAKWWKKNKKRILKK